MRPPIAEYSPSVFSRTTQKSMSPGLRSASGDGTPGISRTGRRLTYWSNSRRNRMQRAPQRDVVRHLGGPADRAEEDRVVLADLVLPVLRHHAAVLFVVVAGGEIEVVAAQLEAEFLGRRLQHAHALRHDLLADAVARDDGDAMDAVGGPWASLSCGSSGRSSREAGRAKSALRQRRRQSWERPASCIAALRFVGLRFAQRSPSVAAQWQGACSSCQRKRRLEPGPHDDCRGAHGAPAGVRRTDHVRHRSLTPSAERRTSRLPCVRASTKAAAATRRFSFSRIAKQSVRSS